MREIINEYQASDTPHVGAGSPFSTQNHFRTAVLSSLDVVSEMMLNPCCYSKSRQCLPIQAKKDHTITQIRNFHGDAFG